MWFAAAGCSAESSLLQLSHAAVRTKGASISECVSACHDDLLAAGSSCALRCEDMRVSCFTAWRAHHKWDLQVTFLQDIQLSTSTHLLEEAMKACDSAVWAAFSPVCIAFEAWGTFGSWESDDSSSPMPDIVFTFAGCCCPAWHFDVEQTASGFTLINRSCWCLSLFLLTPSLSFLLLLIV